MRPLSIDSAVLVGRPLWEYYSLVPEDGCRYIHSTLLLGGWGQLKSPLVKRTMVELTVKDFLGLDLG